MKILEQDACQQAAQAFSNHKILAVPTDTVYGVGVRFGDLEDLEALKNIKHRPETKPLPVVVSDVQMMKKIVQVDERTEKLVQNLLPGALTLILPLQPWVDRRFFNGNETAAVRIPDAPALLEVVRLLGEPIFLSSANVSGFPAALNAEQAAAALPDAYAVMKGDCREGMASTIVDCTRQTLGILRPGPISLEEIEHAAL